MKAYDLYKIDPPKISPGNDFTTPHIPNGEIDMELDIPVMLTPSPVILTPIRMMVQRTSCTDNITVFFLNFHLLIQFCMKNEPFCPK